MGFAVGRITRGGLVVKLEQEHALIVRTCTRGDHDRCARCVLVLM
jgi:hypothetical protein